MILKFNDATEIPVQSVTESDGRLQILVANTTPEHLRELFTDPLKTQRMRIEEREQLVGEYEGYTEFFRTEEYTGRLYGVVVNQVGKSTEERLTAVEGKVKIAENDIKEMKENSGADMSLLHATIVVARANAQALTDIDALQAKAIYETFDGLVQKRFTAKDAGYKFTDKDILYKTAQGNVTFQEQYRPGKGTESLYTRIDEAHEGTLEDPIPVVNNMEYEYGKYYIEGEKIYICKRGGVPNPEEMYGQKVTLQYLPSELIGQYFELVK